MLQGATASTSSPIWTLATLLPTRDTVPAHSMPRIRSAAVLIRAQSQGREHIQEVETGAVYAEFHLVWRWRHPLRCGQGEMVEDARRGHLQPERFAWCSGAQFGDSFLRIVNQPGHPALPAAACNLVLLPISQHFLAEKSARCGISAQRPGRCCCISTWGPRGQSFVPAPRVAPGRAQAGQHPSLVVRPASRPTGGARSSPPGEPGPEPGAADR